MKIETAKLDIVASALFFLFGSWVIIQAFNYGIVSDIGPDAGTFPLMAGTFIAIFSVLNIVRTIRRFRGIDASEEGVRTGHDAVHLTELIRIAIIVLLIAGYVAVFKSLGAFLPLPFLMLGISLTVHWRTDIKWLLTFVGISVVFTIVCYFLFAKFLGILLPVGPFGW